MQAMLDLSQKGIDINTGEILVEMFEMKPSKRLLTYSRKWLHAFPNHQQGPRVMSLWLKHYPSKESYDLSAKYLKRHWPVGELHWLFNSVVECKPNRRLDRLMEERLEKAPKDEIWSRCLSTYKGRANFANRLALRWLKLNEDNPNLLLQGFTLFVQSPEIVEKVFDHFKKYGVSQPYNKMEINELIDKAHEFKMQILPEVIEFARKWLTDNPSDEDYAPGIHASLVRCSSDESDLKNAKEWLKQNSTSHSSFRILSTLSSMRRDSDTDQFAVEEAKKVLRAMPPGERIPSLVICLLRAQQDEEIIGWAKEVYAELPLFSLLIELIKYAPDADLIAEGKTQLRRCLDTEIGHELLHALLDRAPDAMVRRCARSWLANNSKHGCAKKIGEQISTRQPRFNESK